MMKPLAEPEESAKFSWWDFFGSQLIIVLKALGSYIFHSYEYTYIHIWTHM
jgi:hypothetical protein